MCYTICYILSARKTTGGKRLTLNVVVRGTCCLLGRAVIYMACCGSSEGTAVVTTSSAVNTDTVTTKEIDRNAHDVAMAMVLD